MLTNQQNMRKTKKRVTRQVRVGLRIHKILKFRSIKKGITISKLLDDVCITFLANAKDDEKQLEVNSTV